MQEQTYYHQLMLVHLTKILDLILKPFMPKDLVEKEQEDHNNADSADSGNKKTDSIKIKDANIAQENIKILTD